MPVRISDRNPRRYRARLFPALLFLGGALGCAGLRPVPPAEPAEAGPAFAATAESFSARQARFLGLAIRQLRDPEPGYGPSASRYAAGTLAAAALAARGEPTAAEAARWAAA